MARKTRQPRSTLVQTADQGEILAVLRVPADAVDLQVLEAGATQQHVVPPAQRDRLKKRGVEIERYVHVAADKTVEIRDKTRIDLRASLTEIFADGEDSATLRTSHPDAITVQVNGLPQPSPIQQSVVLRTTTPGPYRIRLVGARHFSDEILVLARFDYEDEDAQDEDAQDEEKIYDC